MSPTNRPVHRLPAALLLLVTLLLPFAACGDDDTPRAALGTTTTTTVPVTSTSDARAAASGGAVLVTGTFGTDEVGIEMADDASCEVRTAGDGSATATVTGSAVDGDRFTLDWNQARPQSTAATLVIGGATWSAGPAESNVAPPVVRVEGVGAVTVVGTFSAIDGGAEDAELLVRCRQDR